MESVGDYSCCKILISFPRGSRIKNLRTPHGSLLGPYSIGMPADLMAAQMEYIKLLIQLSIKRVDFI